MATAMNLGSPRIGPRRELKWVTEAYWRGDASHDDVEATARAIRAGNRRVQLDAGITSMPSNDFSLYDQVLDTLCLLDALPERFVATDRRGGPAAAAPIAAAPVAAAPIDLDRYFAPARGRDGAPPLEMTKWFDTNYHYLVPELSPGTTFRLATTKPIDELREALDDGVLTRPVLLGPITFLALAKATTPGFDHFRLLPDLVPVYAELLAALDAAGADWVQLDEPVLATDLPPGVADAFAATYRDLAAASGCRLLLATYFGGLGDNASLALDAPVDGLHLDLVRDPDQLDLVLDHLAPHTVLSAGVVDGRNVWRNDLRASLARLRAIEARVGADRLWVGPSCSLQHVPVGLDAEPDDRGPDDGRDGKGGGIDPRVRPWLAFAAEKLVEIGTLARGLDDGDEAIVDALAESDAVAAARRAAAASGSAEVRRRLAAITPGDARRRSPYGTRRDAQRAARPLPTLPTTTIGSFPQTAELRSARRRHTKGDIDAGTYSDVCRREIERVVRVQEELGLDLLVHGEPERNDMVQYFGERLAGFVTTAHGWVQSYGSRYVRPPILHGDVTRPEPMTLEWITYAQSLTDAPVKGMLTGPVTILQWSFVRDDQDRADTCRQIALAVRDEVADLEAAGIGVVQVDEPALREGLPLRARDRGAYLDWATTCFRLATAVVGDATQIHSHMCYVELGDILDAVAALDADVLSLEATRSGMAALDELGDADYGAELGPGVYDIHAPHVPAVDEIVELIEAARKVVPDDRLWVNPDCGLKTRGWEETLASLANMVAAARHVRARLRPPGEDGG